MATTTTATMKKIPPYRYASYFKAGWRWCSSCDRWHNPEENAIRCAECGRPTRYTNKNPKNRDVDDKKRIE